MNEQVARLQCRIGIATENTENVTNREAECNSDLQRVIAIERETFMLKRGTRGTHLDAMRVETIE
jgi:hypothetical protein